MESTDCVRPVFSRGGPWPVTGRDISKRLLLYVTIDAVDCECFGRVKTGKGPALYTWITNGILLCNYSLHKNMSSSLLHSRGSTFVDIQYASHTKYSLCSFPPDSRLFLFNIVKVTHFFFFSFSLSSFLSCVAFFFFSLFFLSSFQTFGTACHHARTAKKLI